jgi:hypothetical protein
MKALNATRQHGAKAAVAGRKPSNFSLQTRVCLKQQLTIPLRRPSQFESQVDSQTMFQAHIAPVDLRQPRQESSKSVGLDRRRWNDESINPVEAERGRRTVELCNSDCSYIPRTQADEIDLRRQRFVQLSNGVQVVVWRAAGTLTLQPQEVELVRTIFQWDEKFRVSHHRLMEPQARPACDPTA